MDNPKRPLKFNKTAIIIGAGPAGLTAAYELLKKTNIKPIVIEATSHMGGISRTINYKGNRIDIGGHRFFSKSAKIMDFWTNILPLQGKPAIDDLLLERKVDLNPGGPDPEKEDKVMLNRKRLSRIYFENKFFDYPISLSLKTLKYLGFLRIKKIAISYLISSIKPRNEETLEDFFINRFGKELYETFFKSYTQKVWGKPCNQINPEWGRQRVKSLDIKTVILDSLIKVFKKDSAVKKQKSATSLIQQFMYPKYGPGQFWNTLADLIKKAGGEIITNNKAVGLKTQNHKIKSIIIKPAENNREKIIEADYFFSSMPIKDLISSIEQAPKEIKKIASNLIYREFITVGILLKKLKVKNNTKFKSLNDIIPDCWIYVQEKNVKMARIQIFNNWSPYLLKDSSSSWLGLEYICDENDKLWGMQDNEIIDLAINELKEINFIDSEDITDYTVIRTPKAYPAYFGTYNRLDSLKKFCDKFENLFLIGRNGQHRYNNIDHSMLTAITAVENISKGITTKDNIWQVNTADEYIE